MEWAETLWPVKYATSCFGAAARSNHLHEDHVAQARKGRSVLTEAWSGFTRHITPDYPRENSSVTFPQITHTVDQRSGSNLQEAPPPPHPTKPRQETRGPDRDPGQGAANYQCSLRTLWLCWRPVKKRGLCPGFITASQLGAQSESQFSTFFWLIFYSLF